MKAVISIRLTNEVSSYIHLGKIGEIVFPKNNSIILWQNFPEFFLQSEYWNRIFDLHFIESGPPESKSFF